MQQESQLGFLQDGGRSKERKNEGENRNGKQKRREEPRDCSCGKHREVASPPYPPQGTERCCCGAE